MTPRSLLRVRRGHAHPERREEDVFEVFRNGEVVATIYGSREGIHVVSARLAEGSRNMPFFFQNGPLPPGYVIPLPGDEGPRVCPVCSPL